MRFFRSSNLLYNAGGGPNHYQVLGLKPSASEKDIKTSYFKLAKKFHPDLNPDDSARVQFEKVSKAYQVLTDDMLRSSYDKQQGFSRTGGAAGNFTDHHSHKKRRRHSKIFSDDE